MTFTHSIKVYYSEWDNLNVLTGTYRKSNIKYKLKLEYKNKLFQYWRELFKI